MSAKSFKCPYCTTRYTDKFYLYKHMNERHAEQFEGMSAAQNYFNFRYKKTHGSCIVCGRETDWNEENGRYERICSPRCKELYRQEFRKRMKKKYGKETLLDEPDHQLKMQSNRKIAGTYTWSDGAKMNYLGSYELDALRYLDKELELDSNDVLSPAEVTIPYEFEVTDDNGKKKKMTHFYMPDIQVVSLKLLIEVKGTNNHYQKREYRKEKAKDEAALASEYNYVKVVDKNYDALINIVNKIKSL